MARMTPPRTRLLDRRDRDRQPELSWLRTHAQDYPGQWLALDGHTLIASAPTLRQLLHSLPPTLDPRPLVHYVETHP